MAASFNALAQGWFRSDWSYRKAITIYATNVTGTLTQFPVLISVTDPDLASNAGNAAQDLVFTSSDGTTVLSHEIESYQAASGALTAWVAVPSLSSTSNSVLYLYYGNPATADRQQASGVWDNQYQGVWHLKEDPTGTAPQFGDSTSQSNAGTVSGTVSSTNQLSGKANGALFFNGTDQYVAVPQSASLDLGATGTIEAWFKLGGTGTWRALVTRGEGTSYESHSYFMDFNTSNYLEFGIGDGTHVDLYSSSFKVTDTASFHQMLMTWDGSNLKLYYDGVLRETKTQSIVAGGYEAPMSIGQWGSGDDRFHGILDEVRVSSVARSSNWIATAYRNVNSPSTFHGFGSVEAQTSPRWAFTSIAGGGTPQAGVPFSVALQAQTPAGAAYVATQDTIVQLSVASGLGTLGGTVTGTLAVGQSNVILSGVTYTKAESAAVLTATTISGHTITAADSTSFASVAGPVSSGASSLAASAPIVEANGDTVVTLTATLRDAYSNPVQGKTVSLEDGAATTEISSRDTVSSADGAVTFSVRHSLAQTVTFTATDVTDGITLSATAVVVFQHTPWFNRSWSHRKRLEIDHASFNSDLTGFPLLVSRVDSDLAAHAQADAGDLVFTTADGVTSLSHEIESYHASNGTLVAWVNAPALSAATNTVLFLYFGNSTTEDSQQPTAVWDDDFVAVWHLNDDPSVAAPQIRDSTSFGHHGTAWGSMAATNQIAGQANGALAFDGDNDRILVPSDSSLELTNRGSVEAWFKPVNPGTWRSLFAKGSVDTVQAHSYMLELDTSDFLEYGLADGTNYTLYTSAFAVTNIEAFHHVLMSWDGSRVRLYYNGELRESQFQTLSPNANGADLALGQWGTIYDRFAGILDELRVSKTARTASWVAASYANTLSPSNFVSFSTAESPALPTLVITSVADGGSPAAGTSFSVQVAARTVSGAASPATEDTLITLSLRAGAGTLGGSLSGTLLAGNSIVTLSGVTYTKGETNVVLTATVASGQAFTAADSDPFTTLPGAVSASVSTVEADPAWVEADGHTSGTVVVTLKDAFGNVVAGKTVSLADGGADSVITPATGITDASGSVNFLVTDLTAESVTYTATNTTDALGITPTASITFGHTPWFNASWAYRKVVTIDGTQVAGDLANFPLLVSLADTHLSSHSETSGADLAFTSSDGTNQLAHEIETYVSSNGTLKAWVKIPQLTTTTDTRLFLYYGNPGAPDQQSVAEVWSSSFAAVWHAKDGSGETLTDSTGLGGSASLSPDLEWDPVGPIGTALGFDGSTDFGDIPHSSALNISGTNLTVSGWFKIDDSTGSDMVIIAKFAGDSFAYPWHQYGLEFDTDGDQFDLYLNTESTLVVNHLPTPLNQWVHVAYTYDGTATRGYLNGTLVTEEPVSSPIAAASRDLRIGRDQSYSQPFKGELDELRLAHEARSTAWILTEYRNQTDPGSFLESLPAGIQSEDRLAITEVNSSASPAVDETFAVVVELQTHDGSPRSATQDTTILLTLSHGTGTLGGVLTGTLAAGQSTAVLWGVTYNRAESGVVLRAWATDGDSATPADSAPFTVRAGPVSALHSTLVATPTSVEANGVARSTLVATLLDAYDNPVSGKSVSLSAGSGSSSVSPTTAVSDANGVATFSATDSVAETLVYTATDTTDALSLPQTATVTYSVAPWHNASWLYRKSLTIQGERVGSALTNFPVLVSVTDAHFASQARTNAFDFLFTQSDGVTRLGHEIESYTAATGTLVAWVNLPVALAGQDTVLFLYYGNAATGTRERATNTWDADYRTVWHLSDSDFSDSTSYANTANNSGTTNSTGKIAEARGFDGVNDYVYSTTRFSAPQIFTVEAWFKTSTASGYNIVTYEGSRTGTGSSNWDRHLYVGTDGKVYFECWNGSSQAAVSSATYADGAWHHAVAVLDDTSNRMNLYVDGALADSISSSGAENANGYWRLGSYKGGSFAGNTGYFPGLIDEVRISLSARSADWVAAEYQNQSSPSAFMAISALATNTSPHLAITSVNGGADPSAGSPFSVVVSAQTATGGSYTAVSNTTVTLSLSTGNGTLGGVLTGTLLAGSSTVTVSGVTYNLAESRVVLTATASNGDSLVACDTGAFTVTPGAYAKLQIILTGETAAPGTATGKTGTPTSRSAGGPFDITVRAVDAHWNLVATNPTVAITSSDPYATLPSNAALSSGSKSFAVTLKVAGTTTVTATDVNSPGITPNTSGTITVAAGTINKLQILAPGETAVPGSTTGKTGTPTAQTAGTAFTVTVRAVDAYWNLVSSTHTIRITSSDANATLPANAALSAGSKTFSVTAKTAGSATVTASDVTNGLIASNTSPSITIAARAVSQLAFATQPAGAAAGSVLAQQPVVRTQDAYGNPSTNGLPATLAVSLSLSSGTGSLLGTTQLDLGSAAGNGTASFTDLRVDARGSKTLTASASGLVSAVSDAFSVDNVAPAAAAGAALRPPNVPLKIPIADLLTNATDLNGDALHLSAVASASTNGATLRTNATYLLYAVPPDGNVADAFSYTVSDGLLSATGTLAIAAPTNSAATNHNTVSHQSNGDQQSLAFVGIPGRAYVVQRYWAPDAAPVWTTLHTTNAPVAGRFEYLDATAAPSGKTPVYRAHHFP